MKTLINALEKVLADTYALFLKTQNYHWNVEGCCFKENHELFEKQYDNLFEAIDVCAELIRGLGEKVDGTFENFSKCCTIKEGNKSLAAGEMLQDLAHDHSVVMDKTLREALEAAKKVDDEVVVGFITERMTFHRKNAWLLKSCCDCNCSTKK